jgi:hypothetical protein
MIEPLQREGRTADYAAKGYGDGKQKRSIARIYYGAILPVVFWASRANDVSYPDKRDRTQHEQEDEVSKLKANLPPG